MQRNAARRLVHAQRRRAIGDPQAIQRAVMHLRGNMGQLFGRAVQRDKADGVDVAFHHAAKGKAALPHQPQHVQKPRRPVRFGAKAQAPQRLWQGRGQYAKLAQAIQPGGGECGPCVVDRCFILQFRATGGQGVEGKGHAAMPLCFRRLSGDN